MSSFSPLLSPIITSLKESATLAIHQRVQNLRAKGEEVYHFGFGQSPFPVPPDLARALEQNSHQKAYLPTLGLPELREAFCSYYKKQYGYDFQPDCVIVGPGSKELIFQSLFCLEGPLIIPAPSWVSYGPQAHIRGKAVHTVFTQKENSYKLQAQELRAACDLLMVNRQKILILNNPSNPTGAVYSRKELEAIAEVARENAVIIISDEIYSLITWNEEGFCGWGDIYPEGSIVTSGLSKSFSAGGYRLGLLAAPKNMSAVIKALSAMISETFSAVSAPTQYAALACFDASKETMDYVRRCTRVHQATSLYLFRRLIKMGAGCSRPRGAFYLFPDFNDHVRPLKRLGISTSSHLCDYFLDELRVAALPSSDFFFPDDYLACRMATVDYDGEAVLQASGKLDKLDDEFVEKNCPNLKKGMDQLEKFLKELS